MSDPWPEYDVLLDARQFDCPLPLLKSKLLLKTLSSGQVLKVEAGDAGSWQDIAHFVSLSPYALLHRCERDGAYHFWIQV